MPFLDPNLPFLADIEAPDSFTSPFPSSYDSPKLQALGGLSSGILASQGAHAWAVATQIALKAKAVHAGDLRSDWLARIVTKDPETQIFKGAFASVSFRKSANAADLQSALVQTGFDVASGLISAVPVYGQALAGVIAASQFFVNLLKRPSEEQKFFVPWQEYSQGLDEDLCRAVVFPTMESFDWTRLFYPSLDWSGGWRWFETEEGPNTLAWGTFGPQGGPPRYTTSVPESEASGGGLGFMPGTQMMADITQLAVGARQLTPNSRIDAITQVGDFYPATSQACMSLWEQVMKAGSPDMFKVRAGVLADAWASYFGSMRGAFGLGWQQITSGGKPDFESAINLGKLMSPFLLNNGQQVNLEGINGRWAWPGMSRKTGAWQPDPNDGRPGCPPKGERQGNWAPGGWLSDPSYQAGSWWPPDRCGMSINQAQRAASLRWMDQGIILPTLNNLKIAQHRALYRTIICAYVRPKPVGGLPAYAAFSDPSPALDPGFENFGDELRQRCEYARSVLLNNELRFKVRLTDVDAIDPIYANQLRDSGVDENSWKTPISKLAIGAGGLGPSQPVPPSDGPQGGAPFSRVTKRPEPGGGGAGLIVGAAAVAAMAAFAAKGK